MRTNLLIALGAVCVATTARAHDGYHSDIAALAGPIEAGDPVALVARAGLHRRAGHVMEAYVDAENAVLAAPDAAAAYLERGLALSLLGAGAAAEEDLDLYLDAGGDAAEALVAKAKLAREGGRLGVARVLYDAAIERAPRPDLILERGELDVALGDLDAAASGYEEGMKRLAGAHVVRRALVRLETRRGAFDRALTLADEALSASPTNAEWLLERADVRAARGDAALARTDREAALAELDAGLARRPTELRRVLRGRALLSLGRVLEAERELAGVMERAGPVADVEALLAACREVAR
ncbi:MAG: hypothetical protein IPM79_05005 [Polyangiaceae bacterium]|nr:hypothetical protein [Polyangiaceae bacterium]MBK8937004.1 hypothetical protein [Polyangiaceae bacterium]